MTVHSFSHLSDSDVWAVSNGPGHCARCSGVAIVQAHLIQNTLPTSPSQCESHLANNQSCWYNSLPPPLATFSPNTLTPCRQPTMAQLHLSIRPFPLWHLTLNTFGNSTPECLFQKQNTRQAVLYAPIWEWHSNKSPFYAVRRFIWPLACCCKSGQEQSSTIFVSPYIQNTQQLGHAFLLSLVLLLCFQILSRFKEAQK